MCLALLWIAELYSTASTAWHVLNEFQRKERDGGMHRTSGFILCQLSPDGAAAWNRGPTSAAAQAAIAWTTERGCERELGEVTRKICMFFNSTGNSPSQLRALLVATVSSWDLGLFLRRS